MCLHGLINDHLMVKPHVLPPQGCRTACTVCKTLCPQKRLIKSLTNLPVYDCTFTEFSLILAAITELEQSPEG